MVLEEFSGLEQSVVSTRGAQCLIACSDLAFSLGFPRPARLLYEQDSALGS
jgi:hypothetical protein